MSQDNQITLRGFLTAEPKFRQTVQTGTPVTEIRVGSTPRRLNRETGEWQESPTSYYTVKCWRRLAINTVGSLHKGDMVIVRGRFYMNTWVDSQQRPRATLEIEADSVGHDLAYGWTHYLRGSRPQTERSDGVNAGEQARQDTGPSGPDDGDDAYPGAGPGNAYPAAGDPGDPGDLPAAGPAADGEADLADPGADGDPLAFAPATSITEGEEVDGQATDDALAASALAGDPTLSEVVAAPF